MNKIFVSENCYSGVILEHYKTFFTYLDEKIPRLDNLFFKVFYKAYKN